MVERSAVAGVRWLRCALPVLAAALLCLLLASTSARAAGLRLSGIVWADADADGVRDAGERGRAGVRVEVLSMRRASLTIVRGVQTDASGSWSVPIGPPGTYRARVLLPGSSEGFAPRNRGEERLDSDVVVAGPRAGMTPPVKVRRGKPQPSRRLDAGLLMATAPAQPAAQGSSSGPPPALVTVGDLVWRDSDADGIQDPTESGIGGIAVELWNAARTALLATTTTNGAGHWALPAVAGSSYRVRVVSADLVSPKHAGPDTGRDSDIEPDGADAGFSEVFTPGASTVDIDAGLFMAVGDRVWRDLDSNGVQDAGEPGIAGVVVQLWNASKTMLHASATTGASGGYLMIVPTAGSYRVRVLLPGGSTGFSAKDAGGADAFDSDVNPSGPDLGFTDAFALPGGFSFDLDAGVL